MTTQEYSRAIRLAQSHSDEYDPNGPFSETEIVTAERSLGIAFPADFRQFLADFGSGYLGVQGMYGLVPDPSYAAFPNIVWLTLDNRARFGHPNHLLVISDDGYGSDYVMDLRDGDDPAVWLWPGGTPFEEAAEKGYPSFGHFLLDVAKNMTAED